MGLGPPLPLCHELSFLRDIELVERSLRATPFEKVGWGMSAISFSDYFAVIFHY